MKKLIKEYENNVKITNIDSESYYDTIELCQNSFKNVMDESFLKEYLDSVVDWDISIVAKVNDKVVGCYLFKEENIFNFFQQTSYLKSLTEDLSKYQNMKGLQGVALVVSPTHRGLGIGKKLREFPKLMDFDYIWGIQLKSLENVSDWLKSGRRLVAETPNEYITIMDLK